MQDEDEVPEEFIQAAEEAAKLARIAAEVNFELAPPVRALREAIQAGADFELPVVRQMRELAPALAEYQSARLREMSELVLPAADFEWPWMRELRRLVLATADVESPWMRELRELAPALAKFQSTQLGAVVSTLQSALPVLMASQPWAEINRSIAEMMTKSLLSYSTQSILASDIGRAQPATFTVLQPVAQDPTSDTPAKVTGAPQTPARRNDQVIPQWLWLLALVAVAFTVSAAQERLPSVAQTTVGNMITWFSLLLALYMVCKDSKR